MLLSDRRRPRSALIKLCFDISPLTSHAAVPETIVFDTPASGSHHRHIGTCLVPSGVEVVMSSANLGRKLSVGGVGGPGPEDESCPNARRRLRATLAMLALLGVVLQPVLSHAYPGELDATFGTAGVVTTDFAGDDAIFGLVQQTDGKLVAGGIATGVGGADFAVCRYDANGVLDPSFGTGGKLLTDFGGNRCVGGARHGRACVSSDDCIGGRCVSSSDTAWAVALQADGKIVAAGDRRVCVGGDRDGEHCFADSDCPGSGARCLGDVALARYNVDGSLDLTFGSAGRVVTDFGGDDTGFAVVVQSDGRIVVGGASASAGDMDFALVRYSSNGALDPSFGSGGQVLTDLGGYDQAFALVAQPDGKLVAAGVSTAGGSVDFALVRYGTSGALDATFGSGGQVITDFGPGYVGSTNNCTLPLADFRGIDVAYALRVQPDGKLVAAGASTNDFALARYNTDGSLDLDFGTCGRVITDFAGEDAAASALVVQPDGKLVVAGRRSVGSESGFALARYNTNGTLDSTMFGIRGRTLTQIGSDAEAFALVLLPEDGRLVAAGAANGDFALARYEGDFATLALNRAGTGSGTVTSDPAGIECGGSCSARFLWGSTVNLSPTAAPDSVFIGWSGDPDCSDGVVTLDGDKTCTATFHLMVSLTVSQGGTGAGTITSDPAGIECGGSCSARFLWGSTVNLSPTAAPDSVFMGWSGDPDCSDGVVTLDGDKTCTATFHLMVSLTVSQGGTGSGTITSDPAGIACGDSCTASYPLGTVVTLTATPEPGASFSGWAGDPDCADGAVTLDREKVCTANFASLRATLEVIKTGAGAGTVTSDPPGIECGSSCSAVFDRGTEVRLTATAAPGSSFVGWSGNCSADGGVTLDMDRTCRAIFSLNGPDLTGTWAGLRQTCRGASGQSPCRLKGRFVVKNTGVRRAERSMLRFFLSDDGATPATPLGEVSVPAMRPNRARRVAFRYAMPGQRADGLFVLAMVDADETVLESSEENNTIPFGPLR